MPEGAAAGGIVTQWLAIIGVISLLYWAWRIVAALRLRRGGRSTAEERPAAAAAATATVDGPAPLPAAQDIAAIAAGIHAVLGAHRIIHLAPASSADPWAGEGRWMQQTSHRPGSA